MGYCRSPWYNEHFCYKLDFLANQKPWLPYLLNQYEKQAKGHKALYSTQEYNKSSCSVKTGKLQQQTNYMAVI